MTWHFSFDVFQVTINKLQLQNQFIKLKLEYFIDRQTYANGFLYADMLSFQLNFQLQKLHSDLVKHYLQGVPEKMFL